jgi:hypothetical protein
MGMYCLVMLCIALELARVDRAYEDVASKFFEHFIYIANAINHLGRQDMSLWDESDGFYYDMLHCPGGAYIPLRVRSFVGLIPLFAATILEPDLLEMLPKFRQRMEWFIKYRPHLVENIASLTETGPEGRRLLSIANRRQLERVLQRMLDPKEFLSDYGLRSLSKYHEQHPYTFSADGQTYTVRYEPADSKSAMFGGNSNWRGPIWFPMNYLMIEALRTFHGYYGDDFQVESPQGSGHSLSLAEVAVDLSRRLTRIFLTDLDAGGRRPFLGGVEYFQNDPYWRDHILFYEYFHGDNGAGIGASHQTGWTALVAMLIHQCGGQR